MGTETRDRRCAECSLLADEERTRRRTEWLKE
jgi:hypothetical protein